MRVAYHGRVGALLAAALLPLLLAPDLASARPPMETNQLVDGNGVPLGTAENPLNVVGGGGGGGGATGSVTDAGVNGTKAQAVQGINGGVPLTITGSFLLDTTFTGRINTLGQKTMAQSTPVVLPSDQTLNVNFPADLAREGTDGPGTNPGAGIRGWLSGIYARLTTDPATGARQDTANSTAATNATNTGNTATATGSRTDAATTSGSDTSIVGALRAIRDRLLGVLAVANTPAPTSTTGSVTAYTAGTTSAQAVAATTRRFLAIDNESATANIACSFGGTAALNTAGSFTIPAGATRTWDGNFVPADAVNCIASAASTPVTIQAN